MSFDLLELPPHVVEYVLSCLGKDLRSLLRCRLVCPQMNVMIFDAKLDFLWKRLSILQKPLSLTKDRDEAEKYRKKALSFLAFLHNVADHLTHLKFTATNEVPVMVLQSFPSLPALTTFDLSWNLWLDTPHLQELAQKCDTVVNVNLRSCFRLSSSALAAMTTNWTRLESIDLSLCDKLNDKDGHLSRFHDSLNALKKYNIERIGIISDATILRLLNRDGVAERLIELRLRCFRLTLTNASVTSIATCSNLEFLVLDLSFDVTDDAALQTLKNLAALKHLHLTCGHNSCFTPHGLEDFFRNASFQLQHLKLEHVRYMNDIAMEHVLLRNQGLKSLGLEFCNNITVTDTGMQHLRGLSQLLLLSLGDLPRVTRAIFNFDADMLPDLRFIHLRSHCGISQTDVDGIRQKLPRTIVAYQDSYQWSECPPQLKDMEGACCLYYNPQWS